MISQKADSLKNLLFEWGRTSLQAEKFPGYLAELTEEIKSLYGGDASLLSEILPAFVEEIKGARNIIARAEIVDFTPEDSEWADVLSALATFDKIVFLIEGMSGALSSYDNAALQSSLEVLSEELRKVTDLVFSEDFSCLRLTPYNVYRQNKIDAIEEGARYLFPWNSTFSDEPGDLIFDLCENFHLLINQSGSRHIPEHLQQGAEFYLFELHRDSQLHAFIKERNRLIRSLEETIRRHWAFRLWSAARRAGVRRLLPEKVEEIGLNKVAEMALQDMAKTTDSFLVDVLRCCFGPGIDDTQRLNSLLQLEDVLSKKGEVISNKYIGSLVELAGGRCFADTTAELLLDCWIDALNSAAEKIIAAEAYARPSLAQTPSAADEQGAYVVGIAVAAALSLLLKKRVGRLRHNSFMSSGRRRFPQAAGTSNFLEVKRPDFQDGGTMIFFDEKPDASKEEQLAHEIYTLYQEQEEKHFYFACFFDSAGALLKEHREPEELPRSGNPVELDVPKGASVCIVVMGESDHVKAEWEIWRAAQEPPSLQGESKVYIVAFVAANREA